MRNPDDVTKAALERLLQLVGEREARQIVGAVAGASVRAEFERVTLRRLAARLLAERAPRYEIRGRLESRGVHWRTAYRVIDAALGAGPLRCVTEGVELASEVDTLAPPQPPDSTMTESLALAPIESPAVAAMRERLAQLQAQLSALDIPAAKEAAAKAWDRRTSLERQVNMQPVAVPFGGFVPGMRQQELDAAQREATAARNRVQQLERDANALPVEIMRLSRLLGANERVQQLRENLTPAGQLVEQAEAQVKSCRTALATIGDMIETETRAFETSRATAATELLAAVKSGADAGKVKAATRDKIETLELARVDAQQELDAASAAHEAAKRGLAAAWRAVHDAECDVAELAQIEADRVYVETTAAYLVAANRARRQGVGVRDPRGLAFETAQRQSVAEERAQ